MEDPIILKKKKIRKTLFGPFFCQHAYVKAYMCALNFFAPRITQKKQGFELKLNFCVYLYSYTIPSNKSLS